MKIRQLFDSLIPRTQRDMLDGGQGYGRTAVNGVLRHNDRINTVQRLMHAYNNVNKYLVKQNASEEVLIKRLEQQEAKQKGGDGEESK
jgi:hypothetical protein